jgi:hypothetical protein
VVQVAFDRLGCGARNLVIIVIQTNNGCARELGNVSGRAAYTAPNVKHLHTGFEVELRR